MQGDTKGKFVFFLTGASGVGKTTLVRALEQSQLNKDWLFFHFDSIGVPSASMMQLHYGSPSEWQKAKTFEWVDRLLSLETNQKIILEGQVNLQFIRDAFKRHDFNDYLIILIDCHELDMGSRLALQRQQPELFTPDMKRWREYLRQQAKQFQTDIIDTSQLSPDEAVQALARIIDLI
ncbi:AAA family ATPase [Chryseolinea sp. T2]|uniref:AAA family ATPase n=1 Tax=Chryseolinea sp. T2 TaxID=3129255 RepID=UPI00307723BC